MTRISLVVLLVVLAAVLSCSRAGDASAQGLPSALNWGGKSFVDSGTFGRWLERRGKSYDAWARLHPQGRAILESAAARGRPSTSKQASAQDGPFSSPTASSQPAGNGGSGDSILMTLLVLASVLMAVSLLPFERLLPSDALVRSLSERRVLLVTPAVAILVGVAIAKLTT